MTMHYIEARGSRKTALARIRIISEDKKTAHQKIVVNGKDYNDYFKLPAHRAAVVAPLTIVGGPAVLGKRGVSVLVRGGGATGQAEAVRHGLARALVKLEAGWRKQLKVAGFLTRDPRAVERKKYGLKKARRAPQWSKR